MKIIKRLLSGIVAVAICLNLFAVSAFAAETEVGEAYHTADLQWSDHDGEYLEKVVSVADYYYIENEILKISLSEDALLNDFHFTQEQYDRLMTGVIGKAVYDECSGIPMTRASIKNGALYISYDELAGGALAVM